MKTIEITIKGKTLPDHIDAIDEVKKKIMNQELYGSNYYEGVSEYFFTFDSFGEFEQECNNSQD